MKLGTSFRATSSPRGRLGRVTEELCLAIPSCGVWTNAELVPDRLPHVRGTWMIQMRCLHMMLMVPHALQRRWRVFFLSLA
jgi:hypothetical protein